jgi:hypothetical protein
VGNQPRADSAMPKQTSGRTSSDHRRATPARAIARVSALMRDDLSHGVPGERIQVEHPSSNADVGQQEGDAEPDRTTSDSRNETAERGSG